jgi:hypothetical protein
MSGESTRFFVGRNGGSAPDALSGSIREALGEERARDLDDLATLAGEEVLAWPERVLQSQRGLFADCGAERAAESLASEVRTDGCGRKPSKQRRRWRSLRDCCAPVVRLSLRLARSEPTRRETQDESGSRVPVTGRVVADSARSYAETLILAEPVSLMCAKVVDQPRSARSVLTDWGLAWWDYRTDRPCRRR